MQPRSKNLVIGIFISFAIGLNLANATTQSNETAQLKSMISELKEKIEDADKRMTAHPKFLDELRLLVQKYKSRLRERFFKDTFNDGNYDKNPIWTVKSGDFSVTSEGRLNSYGPLKIDETESSPSPVGDTTLEQEAVGIILDSIFGPQKQKKQQTQPAKKTRASTGPAYLFTRTTFPPDFEMVMKFKSSESSEMDVLLLGSKNYSPRYRLKIKTAHSEADPMEIIRDGSSRSYTIAASDKLPVINDGKFHTLTWMRLSDGEMKVLIDDTLVLQTYEVYYRDQFTGLGMMNTAGSHEWDLIEIYRSLTPKAE